MGFFFGTGPSWKDDSLKEIQVSSVLNAQERRSRENQGNVRYEPFPEKRTKDSERE